MTVDETFENYVPLSQSPVWDLLRSYYDILGVDAWAPGRVPDYVTTNPFIARAYAKVIRGFLEDFGQGRSDRARREPHYIVELGAGPGRFSHGFLRHFFSPEEQAANCRQHIVYVMTDVCEANIEFWRQHPQLKPFVDQGVLDFAYFDVLKDDPIRLLISGRKITPGGLSNPLAVIANYVIDSLPHDFYTVRDNQLFERRVCHRIETDSDDIAEIVRATRFDYHEQPTTADIYEHEDWNRLLEKYRKMTGELHISLPVGGFRMIDRLQQLTTGPMFLLSGDFGVSDLLALSELPPRKVPTNGTFNLHVNYHAISQYVDRKKGQYLTPGHAKSSLEMAGVLMNRGRRKARHLTYQFDTHIRDFGPDEYFMLKKIAEENFAGLSLPQCLALLRMSYGDIKMFRGCAETLRKTLPMAGALQKQSVVEALKKVDEAHFRGGSALDPAIPIILLMLEAGDVEGALDVVDRNRQFLEATTEGTLLAAEILWLAGRAGDARDPLKNLLRREPGHREAQVLLDRIADNAEASGTA
ncbi:SAM-dependent methyltransferase [Sneathiella sp. CAU 1612]|uniref:SAM-dependent methyltransferase n=1 Tax=Sneathiella sedimenti TaxID=2816034 RepID=A0ABS3F5J9_9PROT|nr:SAM-dependent methyltransferase [Sneathiella sedimenti]MBO0333684.1 SAM-dependent methyltransferase [Sneathiella sedimenti]